LRDLLALHDPTHPKWGEPLQNPPISSARADHLGLVRWCDDRIRDHFLSVAPAPGYPREVIYRPRAQVINPLEWGKPLRHTCPACGESGFIKERVGEIETGQFLIGLNRHLVEHDHNFTPFFDHRCRSCRTRLLASLRIDDGRFALAISTYESETS